MQMVNFFCAVMLSVLGFFGAEQAPAGDWAVSGEQIAPIPLPYQAARVRIVARYTGTAPSAPTSNFPFGMFREVRLPDSTDFRKTFCLFQFGWGRCGEDRNDKHPQAFQPGDELSLSVSFAGQFEGSPELAVLFRRPGTYEVKTGGFEPLIRHNVRIVSAPIPVVIKAPEGEDKEIYEQLAQDEALVYALLVPVYSPTGGFVRELRASVKPTREKIIPALRKLIADHPKSSYADYARFALARWLFYDKEHGNIYSADIPMKQLDHEHFAYGDYSLSLLREILHATGSSDEAVPIAARLDKAFPDSPQRLEDLARRVSQEEWNKLNPRKPLNRPQADK